MAFFDWIYIVLIDWVNLFIAPYQNFDMLWIIIPIWISFLFTEFYQEKKGTSFGNAISNGVVILWVGFDWIRTLIRMLNANEISMDGAFWAKVSIAVIAIIFGLFIIIEGIKLKRYIHIIGRIRVITYFLIMFTPLFYEPELFSIGSIIVILVFAPAFYFVIQILDWIIPDPKVYDEDEKKEDPFSMAKQGDDPFKAEKLPDINSLDTKMPDLTPAKTPAPDFNNPNFRMSEGKGILSQSFFNNADRGDPFAQPQQNVMQNPAQNYPLNEPNFNNYQNY